jgi:hypothetical protein
MTIDERKIDELYNYYRNEKLQNDLLLAKQQRDESRQHEAEAKLELVIAKEKLKVYSLSVELLHAERNFCSAAIAYADAKASIEPQATEYKRTLAALQELRRGTC